MRSTSPTYGVLNTRNFQQLLDDCQTNESLRNEVISLLHTDVPNFFLNYFDLHPAATQHITQMTGTDIWGKAFAMALERGYTIRAEIDDPSRWEFGYDRIRVKLDFHIRHSPDCKAEFEVTLEIVIE